MVEYVIALVLAYRYLAIFFLLMTGIIALPIPDEILMSFIGFLVLKGQLDLVPAVAAAWLGSCAGVTVSYILGRTLGHALVVWLHGSPEKAEKVREWFNRRGKWSLVIGYYIPGVRHFTAIIAGTTQLSLHVFCLFAYAGAFVWTLSYILLGYYLGERTVGVRHFFNERWVKMSELTHYILLLITALAILGLLVWFGLKAHKARFGTKQQP
jgi:membrane protein DedA with SNARE-associated domain